MSTTKHDTDNNSSAAAVLGSAAEPHFAAFIAIDWGDEKHAVALRVAGQTQTEHTTLEQKPQALTEWIAGLRQRFAGGTLAVILEQKRGALRSTRCNRTSIWCSIPSIRR